MNRFTLFILIGILLLSAKILRAQVVTSSPAYPKDNQAVTITFHADKGTAGLQDFTGDVYAHTGVITNNSGDGADWKYVKAGWAENIPACKLTRIEANEYQLSIAPDIRQFYGVPDGEQILQLAFVFRNSDGSLEGKDDGGKNIFVDVAAEGLSIQFTNPSKRWTIIEPGQSIDFNVIVSTQADIWLTLNNSLPIGKTTGTQLSKNLIFEKPGDYSIVAHALSGNQLVTDTTLLCIKKPVSEQTTPANNLNGINYNADGSVTLVLHAPYKQNVFLLGDFNNWVPQNAFQLQKDGEHWWITLNNLLQGTEYAFQYLVDGSIAIADPYADKVLDPSNDPYIPENVYPGLKEYPNGKAEGIVSIIHPGKPAYDWEGVEKPQIKTNDLVIYELLIRDFVETHAIKDVENKLDYLQKLGINAIELMPFNEFEGNSSWGYNPSFYFAPDKYYGTETDYKNFIKACHKRGILVIMDMVFNHAYGQCPLVQLYFDASAGAYGQPTAQSPWFNQESPNNAYSWGFDYNHESVATQAYIDRALAYWMNEFQVDGFRFDFTKGFTNTKGDGWAYDASRIAILKRIKGMMESIDPHSLMICEHLSENREETELASAGILLWGNMNYAYNESTMGWMANSDFSWASYKKRGWTQPNLISYMESHDEERLMFKNIQYGNSFGPYTVKDKSTALERVAIGACFYFTIPGPKMIWQFGELGYDYSIDFNGRVGEKPIRWDYFDEPDRKALYDVFSKLAWLTTNYDVFETTDFTLNVGNNIADKSIILRSDETDVVVVGNFGVQSITTQVPFTENGWWYEFFSNDSLEVVSTTDLLLEPGEYRIYLQEKVLPPSGLDKINNKSTPNRLVIFPNPASDLVTIQSASELSEIRIYSMEGQLQGTYSTNKMNVAHLSSGIYIVRAYSPNGIQSGLIQKL